MTPYQLFREKSAVPMEWRSITPFISRDDKEKTPFELGSNIIQQLASYHAIIDKACVMDISLDEERPAKFLISEHSVIDRAAVMDLSNVEIIYVEDDDIEESDYRESETPESSIAGDHAVSVKLNKSSYIFFQVQKVQKKICDSQKKRQFCVKYIFFSQPSEERENSAEPVAGSDDEGAGEKKAKKSKKAKKTVKKTKEKKEKEPSPPKLKLDMGDSKPKVNKAAMFQQKKEEVKPLGKCI